jgi:signal transduction histidine kinase/FixJ family two-component response regulator
MDNPLVLVLDDEPGITLLCKRLLTRAGFHVLAFTEPRKAMEELSHLRVDLLLVDIRMPDVDGFQVIAHAQHSQPDIAVLVMTGFGTVETAIRALRQGVDGLLLKPFEKADELISSVRQALVDKQNKRDAARIQTLRPLFSVTESLLSETHPQRLLDLILSAVCGHLSCSQAAYYQLDPATGQLILLAGRGILPFDAESAAQLSSSSIASPLGTAGQLSAQAVSLEVPAVFNAVGPGDPALQSELTRRGLAAAMFVPVSRPGARSLLYAGRESAQASFREADLEMFQILARQAVVAMENARLYAELRDYVRRVEDSQQALLQAEKMAAAGRLTASIAHEINNPLQAVQNCIHLAGREDLPLEKRAEYFELARSELDRLRVTVQRMLDFYRPNAVSPEAVDIAGLLSRVLGLMAKQLEERDIHVKRNVPADLPPVNAVSSQIQQVFINLILNAYDAMASGGELQITARAARDGVEILFQDTGPGIPSGESRNIFEPFVSTKEGGTGLGLTVSYNIVTAHGGALELVPSRAPGACFRVYLPSGGVN